MSTFTEHGPFRVVPWMGWGLKWEDSDDEWRKQLARIDIKYISKTTTSNDWKCIIVQFPLHWKIEEGVGHWDGGVQRVKFFDNAQQSRLWIRYLLPNSGEVTLQRFFVVESDRDNGFIEAKVMVGKQVIHCEQSEIPEKARVGDLEQIHEQCEDRAREWLKKQYPDFLDPYAYWKDDTRGELTKTLPTWDPEKGIERNFFNRAEIMTSLQNLQEEIDELNLQKNNEAPFRGELDLSVKLGLKKEYEDLLAVDRFLKTGEQGCLTQLVAIPEIKCTCTISNRLLKLIVQNKTPRYSLLTCGGAQSELTVVCIYPHAKGALMIQQELERFRAIKMFAVFGEGLLQNEKKLLDYAARRQMFVLRSPDGGVRTTQFCGFDIVYPENTSFITFEELVRSKVKERKVSRDGWLTDEYGLFQRGYEFSKLDWWKTKLEE